MIGSASYKGRYVYVIQPWNGMSVFFVVDKGADPRCRWGLRTDFEAAFHAASELIDQEAGHEQSSRGRS